MRELYSGRAYIKPDRIKNLSSLCSLLFTSDLWTPVIKRIISQEEQNLQ